MAEVKSFKDTAFGQLLTQKLPDIASKIGDVLPDNGALGIIKNIISAQPEDTVSAPDKLALLQEADNFALQMAVQNASQAASFNNVESVQVAQEDKFTKRARPFIQYCAVLILVFCYPVAFFFTGKMCDIPGDVLTTITIVITGYTVTRGAEKISGANQQAGTGKVSLLGNLLGQKSS